MMSDLRCEVCGKGLVDGVALWRANPKGKPGIWRCGEHRDAREVVED